MILYLDRKNLFGWISSHVFIERLNLFHASRISAAFLVAASHSFDRTKIDFNICTSAVSCPER